MAFCNDIDVVAEGDSLSLLHLKEALRVHNYEGDVVFQPHSNGENYLKFYAIDNGEGVELWSVFDNLRNRFSSLHFFYRLEVDYGRGGLYTNDNHGKYFKRFVARPGLIPGDDFINVKSIAADTFYEIEREIASTDDNYQHNGSWEIKEYWIIKDDTAKLINTPLALPQLHPAVKARMSQWLEKNMIRFKGTLIAQEAPFFISVSTKCPFFVDIKWLYKIVGFATETDLGCFVEAWTQAFPPVVENPNEDTDYSWIILHKK